MRGIRSLKKKNILIGLIPVEIDDIRKQYGIKEVIITHLEENWGKSYDDYQKLKKELHSIRFAYDGMKIR